VLSITSGRGLLGIKFNNDRNHLELQRGCEKGMGTCIKYLLLEFKADFVGFQETEKKYTDKFFRNIDPHQIYNWHWFPSNGRSGGILCGVKTEEFEVIKVEEHEFAVTAEVKEKKNKTKIEIGHSVWASP
jgi:hypothetical protein